MLTIVRSKADVVVIASLAKHAAQAIRKLGEIDGYDPVIYLDWSSTGIDTVLKPAGLEKAKGIVSTAVIKHPDDPAWADDEGVKYYVACLRPCDERGACQYPDLRRG